MARMVAGPLARWAFLISSTEAIDASYVLKWKLKIKLRKEREAFLEPGWEIWVWLLGIYNQCLNNSHPVAVNKWWWIFEWVVDFKVCVLQFIFGCVYVYAFVLFSVLHQPIYDECIHRKESALTLITACMNILYI